MKRHIDKATWPEIRTAYASGIGLRELARSMGIPEGTVLTHAKREGWTQQIQCAKALAKREDAVVASPVESGSNGRMQERAERPVERMAGISERGVDHIETMDGPGILRSIDEIEKLDKVARRTLRLDDTQATGQITLNVLNVSGSMRVEHG